MKTIKVTKTTDQIIEASTPEIDRYRHLIDSEIHELEQLGKKLSRHGKSLSTKQKKRLRIVLANHTVQCIFEDMTFKFMQGDKDGMQDCFCEVLGLLEPLE